MIAAILKRPKASNHGHASTADPAASSYAARTSSGDGMSATSTPMPGYSDGIGVDQEPPEIEPGVGDTPDLPVDDPLELARRRHRMFPRR